MTIQDFIKELALFIEAQTQFIIADLQRLRFESQGAFNGHERWVDNRPDVKYEKYDKLPLIDTGELLSELTNPANWDLKTTIQGNKISLTIPDKESFTDPKYDKLDTGGFGGEYIGTRTGKRIKVKNIPARPFKDLNAQDVDWIVQQLEKRIRDKYT